MLLLRYIPALLLTAVALAAAAAEPHASRAAQDAATAPTDAERIVRLQRAVDDARKTLEELRAELDSPESEFRKAEAEFQELDKSFEAKSAELQSLRQTDRTQDIESAQKELQEIQKRRELARNRFDLAIQARKARQEQITALQQKLDQDTLAIDKLTGAATTQPASAPAASAAKETAAGAPAVAPPQEAQDKSAETAPAKPPAGIIPAAAGAGAAAPGATADAPSGAPMPPPKEVIEAREAAAQKGVEAQQARQELESIDDRIAGVRRNMELEDKLLRTARERADNAQETERALYDDLQKRWDAGASAEELQKLRASIAEARTRLRDARRESREHSERRDKLQAELDALQTERIVALKAAEAKQKEADDAARKVVALESPYSLHNIAAWLTTRGPRLAGVIVAIIALLWLTRRIEKHLVRVLARRCDHGSFEDCENRARTLVSVFHGAATAATLIGGVLMLLTELSINIVPLMGGAAVVGLAVAFGAQNLLRDFFYGFMILLENQYTLNDVVKVGDVSGQVERISLRLTVLRGLDGTVHFIPNGEITRVSNMTQGWSRALFDIPIAYKEDVDRVMELLVELAKELRRDPDFRGMILEMPEMLGVDEFADSAVVIKFFIKTRPLKQWSVKRELLRRIKNRFDELGIEIPYPHRTVFVHDRRQPALADGEQAVSMSR